MRRMRPVAIAGLLSVCTASGGAQAKDKAEFLQGTFATETGCKMLKALSGGTPRRIETAPEVLTQEGFKGWESDCEFTKVFEHDPGRIWLGMKLCFAGPSIGPQTFVFIKGQGGNFEVAASGQDQPEIYVRCETAEGKNKP